jgi:hypothetical protein
MSNVEVHFGIGIADGQAVEELKKQGAFDLAIIWGYGDGLAPHDPETLLADISAALKCPTITPNVLNVFNARTMVVPAWPERIHVER